MKSAFQARDIAKIAAGYAAAETIGHWLLGIWGSNLFPVTIGTYTFTGEWNTFAMIVWPIVLAIVIYAGWFRKQRPGMDADSSSRSALV